MLCKHSLLSCQSDIINSDALTLAVEPIVEPTSEAVAAKEVTQSKKPYIFDNMICITD